MASVAHGGSQLKPHKTRWLTVKLVSSPDENYNNGIDGSPLRYEGKRLNGKGYDTVIYAVGPVAFRPAPSP
ncbi:hypothetical protein COLO4_03830 [Corchorus olitorius]|uniref:Uncharacterized protein n=1 Tax=Corchorus olitorius TaxID=93759 RepID=A0A1R3KWF7_9ROSI|nr:hypothetical protein COLO4_03830 [Corchorus olitorius]